MLDKKSKIHFILNNECINDVSAYSYWGEGRARTHAHARTHTTDPRIKCGTISATMLPVTGNAIVKLLETCVDRTEPSCRSREGGDLIFNHILTLTTSNPQ